MRGLETGWRFRGLTAAEVNASSRNFAFHCAELRRKLDECFGNGFHMAIMGEVPGPP